MEKRNITLSLPKSLLKKAKVAAASEGKSLSELVRESLDARLREVAGYGRARKRQLDLLKRGFDLGTEGRILTTRAELHGRR